MSWRARIAVAAALVALVAVSFAARWAVLTESPYPVGVDGFFYSIQVRALLAHGALQYPAAPLTFWWMAPFSALTDPITGAKLGAALGGALIAIPAWGVGARLGRSAGAGLIAAALAAGSAGSAYLSIEFVKQGIGLTVGLAALWLVLRALEHRTRGRVIAAIAGVIATLLTHKLAAVLVVAIALPAVLGRRSARLRGRRLIYVYLAVIALALVILVLGLVAPQRFVSGADLALFAHAFTTHPQWGAPALATHGFTLTLEHEALIGGLVAIAAAVLLVRPLADAGAADGVPADAAMAAAAPGPDATAAGAPERDATAAAAPAPVGALEAAATTVSAPRPAATAAAASRPTATSAPVPAAHTTGLPRAVSRVSWMFVALGVVLALPFLAVSDPQGLAFRARTAAFVPLAMCAAVVAGALVRRLPIGRGPVLVVIAALLSLRAAHQRREGRIVAHPALVAAAIAASDQIPKNATAIVSERHIEYMVAWFSERAVSLRPEPIPYAQRVRIIALADMSPELQQAIDAARAEPSVAPPIGLHPRHRNGLVLLEEPTWDWILARLPGPVRRHYARWPTL